MLAGLLIAPITAVRGVAQRSGGAAAAELIAQALARQPGAPVHRLFAELEGRPTALIKVAFSRNAFSKNAFSKNLQIFGWLVLGCTKTKFCKKICV